MGVEKCNCVIVIMKDVQCEIRLLEKCLFLFEEFSEYFYKRGIILVFG